jgi:hypothetical protein
VTSPGQHDETRDVAGDVLDVLGQYHEAVPFRGGAAGDGGGSVSPSCGFCRGFRCMLSRGQVACGSSGVVDRVGSDARMRNEELAALGQCHGVTFNAVQVIQRATRECQ